MATNMATDDIGYTYITLHAWYGGSTSVTKCIIQGPTNVFTFETTPKTNWTTDPPVTFTNLQPGTSYNFTVYFYSASNTLVEYKTYSFSTSSYTEDININTGTITATTMEIRAYYRGNNPVDYCIILCNGDGRGTSKSTPVYEWTTDYMLYTGLNPETSYSATATFYYNGNPVKSITKIFTTLGIPDTERPVVSNLNFVSIPVTNGYHVKMTWSASDNVGIVKHWLYRSPPNTESYTSVGYDVSGTAREFTFTSDANGNLFQAGNRYYFRVIAVDAANNQSLLASGTTSYVVTGNRPNNWAWEYTIVSGGSVYSVVGKKVNIMRAAHWNDFTTRINQFRAYKGLSPYSFTQVTSSTSGSAVVSAINQAINAINDMLPVGSKMSTITISNKVAASIFINLRDKLNSIQ